MFQNMFTYKIEKKMHFWDPKYTEKCNYDSFELDFIIILHCT